MPFILTSNTRECEGYYREPMLFGSLILAQTEMDKQSKAYCKLKRIERDMSCRTEYTDSQGNCSWRIWRKNIRGRVLFEEE